MQKLLASTRHSILSYLLSPTITLPGLRWPFVMLGACFFVIFLGLAIQLPDLLLLDTPLATLKPLTLFEKTLLFNHVSLAWARPWLILMMISSIILMLGWLPFWTILFMAYGYASFITILPTFLGYQWDFLLIEIFVSLLFIWGPTLINIRQHKILAYRFIQWMPLILLMTRLFLQSGWGKLVARDYYWQTFTALNVHLYSQPMPHTLSYWFHRFMVHANLSEPLVYMVLMIELAIPFGLLIHRWRPYAAGTLIAFQIILMLTGNFGFFNGLVIVALVLIARLSNKKAAPNTPASDAPTPTLTLPQRIKDHGPLIITSWLVAIMIAGHLRSLTYTVYPTPLLYRPYSTYLFQPYGLFNRMTPNQKSVQLYVSDNGLDWQTIPLKYFDKKGRPDLQFISPYLPRIRWQLWFLFGYQQRPPIWYQRFIFSILNNDALPSILNRDASTNHPFTMAKICMTPIAFDIDSPYWVINGQETCQLFTKDALTPR